MFTRKHKVEDYKIVAGPAVHVETEVRELLARGWVLYGTMNSENGYYSQAMVKIDDSDWMSEQ